MGNKFSAMGAFGVFGALVIGGVLYVSGQKNPGKLSADAPYGEYNLMLNSGSEPDGSGYVSFTNMRGTNFSFATSGYTPLVGQLGELASGGYFANTNPIHGIGAITVSLSSGSVDVYTGFKQYEEGDIQYASIPCLSLSGATSDRVDLRMIHSLYFKIVAASDSVIDSVHAEYSCATSSNNDTLRVRILKPTINGDDEVTISPSNYLWMNTNIEHVETWSNYLFTRDVDGSWYHDFSNVTAASSGYTYSLYVCDTNESISWEYISSSSPVRFGIGEGQNEWVISETNFRSQPSAIVHSYSLTVNVSITGSAPNFGNVQFVYNYSDSTAAYFWGHKISDSFSSSYAYEMNGLDADKELFFKIYIWDSTLENCYIGGKNGANFSINPSTRAGQSVTINFDYPNVSGYSEGSFTYDDGDPGEMSFASQITTVYGTPIPIAPVFTKKTQPFTASFTGENIRIDEDNNIIGLKAGTTTTVALSAVNGISCTFDVTVNGSAYAATEYRDAKWASNEGWFTSTPVDVITGMGEDFYNGIDISSCFALYQNGTQFYNASGVEQSLFYILKDAGVNWIRLKLWVDPKSSNGISYGGGESNIENTIWMAKEVKAAGLKFLLDFHYSDYWTHPGQQILPKAWNDCTSKEMLCNRIESYTTRALTMFQENNALPDMVQLGNEISSGIYLQKYGGSSETLNAYGEPSYLKDKSNYGYGTKNAAEFEDYIQAASRGVNAVDSSIKKVLHWAKGSTISAGTINAFFAAMPSDAYDYAAFSYYPFNCFDTMETARSILSGLSLPKPWFVAETSYPFSGWSYVYNEDTKTDVTNNTISMWTKFNGDPEAEKGEVTMTHIVEEYPFTMAGQANLIHDLTASVVSNGGLGIFYWESAWVPNINVGWAGAGSKTTYSNQGFFSYDGKALANLDLFAQMSPHF